MTSNDLTDPDFEPHPDAFGTVVYDYHSDELHSEPVFEERFTDGRTKVHPEWYFGPPAEWPPIQETMVELVRGKTLDVGCGPARHTRYLEEQGRDVVGIDASEGSIRCARERGLSNAVVMDMNRLGFTRESFDTTLMVGSPLSLCGSVDRMESLLRSLHPVLSDDGTVVLDMFSPTGYEDQDAIRYLDSSPGDERATARREFRVRYGDIVGKWIKMVLLTPPVFRDVASRAGWQVNRLEEGYGSEGYYCVLEPSESQD